MPTHAGPVVQVERVARSCGHEEDFLCYAIDPRRPARRAKFQARRCRECGLAAQAEHNARQARERPTGRRRPKGAEAQLLPPGARLTLVRADGGWHGHLAVAGLRLATERHSLLGVIHHLGRQWLRRHRHGGKG